jgi:hypothetical protein
MRFGGIVLAVLLTLGACSSDPEPKEPKRTATSATPTATPPTMPAQAKEDTPSGAATFVNYFVGTFNYAARTGNATPMTNASPNCEPCLNYAKDFERLESSDRADEDVWTVEDLSVGASRNPIELDAKVSVAGEGVTELTFVLNSEAPFEIRDIYMRDK